MLGSENTTARAGYVILISFSIFLGPKYISVCKGEPPNGSENISIDWKLTD